MSSTDTPVGPSTKSEDRSTATSFGLPQLRLGTIVVGIVLVALALRMWELGDRPLHHDESLDAWWSWLFRNGNYEGYDPVYHGPLRFYITAGFFELFGESEAVARLLSALTGTAVVGLPWFLRRELGRAGTIAAAAALCISPTMLYYSRFGREDAQMVFLTLLALVLGLAYLRRPRTITASALAFVLVCSFAIKESTYLFGLLLAVYVLMVVAAQFDAQNKFARGLQDDAGQMSPAFFSSALAFASVGLAAAVVVGAAADELFAMLALYGGALFCFAVMAAIPSLRAAQLRWSGPRAALFFVAGASAAGLVRELRGGAESVDASVLAIALAVVLVVIAGLLLGVAPVNQISGARDWAVVMMAGAIGLAAKEGLGSQLSAAESVDAAWKVSPAAIAVAVVLVLVGTALLVGPQLVGVDRSALSTQAARLLPVYATAAGLAGLVLIINEYLEVEANRSLAIGAVIVVLAALATLLLTVPESTNPNYTWPPVLRAFAAIGWVGWGVVAVVFAVTWFLFFSVFGQVKQDWASGFTRAIDYWDSQQEVNRGGQPWYYYFFALPVYEWFFVALAAVGSWRALRRPTIMSGLFVWFAIGSLILYSYAGERMPWLIAHPLLPVLMLAGLGVQQLWQHRDHRAMPGIATAVVVGLLLTTGTSIRASFPNGADSREILSQAGQATPHLTTALERLDNIDRIKRQQTGEGATLAIGTANAWPYNWYLRDRQPATMWFDNENGPPVDGSADVIIVDFGTIDLANYADYQSTVFAMRSWWVPTYTDAGPRDWLGYVRSRSLWDQNPNPDFMGVSEPDTTEAEPGIGALLERLQDGANDTSDGWLSFAAGDRDQLPAADAGEMAPSDGRDGCGSVDQLFLVHNDYAFTEREVYPAPVARMGPLDCASDLLARG